MYITAQRAFGVSPDRHFRLLHAAVEEKPKIIVLSVVVQEAEGLEAKDANGKFHKFHRMGIMRMFCNTIYMFIQM
jgi:BAI1-associated protein 3